ncbi:DUF2252 domain-containing protein [Amantichitinum ursilacus]|uniref:DUF2252 domain-containing protein n=1 Tax=Amantichitinum ursilacus TaxID=857265 RepID=A0A0N0GR68_9NEIS|nr:DUF2252 domain-containing protein [Amantichitinum ursilacus]KPC55378.1 hypothetical protein WG78_01935 [Amantichitinum ursilacus]
MLSDTSPVLDRFEFGRSIRQTIKRSSHTHTGNTRRDVIELLKSNSEGRVEKLVPLRYARMLVSPFTFYRGSAIIQAHDLAGTPDSQLHLQICGDAHLSNFGGFATPERNLIFDLNDFDETHPGPWEWDLKRLTASLAVAARHLGHGERNAREAAFEAAVSYQENMAKYAQMGVLDIWYERITFERLVDSARTETGKKMVRSGIEKAGKRTSAELLPKLAGQADGAWTIRDTPPAVFHIHGNTTLFEADDDWMLLGSGEALLERLRKEYLGTLSGSHRKLLERFTVQDVAFKVVGVGSVGTRCLIALMMDSQHQPLFLQIKEARPSVLAKFVKERSGFQHEGRRVVEGQRLMQASSDLFLGWSTGPSGRHFFVRQLRDMKVSAEVELMDATRLQGYGRICGWVLARAHARASGLAPEISGYIGESDRFAAALARYSTDYADQVERDYQVFAQACRSGKLKARTDADYAADFSV